MLAVQSDMLEAVAYDERNQRLTAKFRSDGHTVTYEGVPPEIYDSLLFADSLSGFLESHIEGHFSKN